MPEVDHFLGSSDMLKLGEVLAGRRRAHARRQPGRLGRRARRARAPLSTPGRQRVREDRRGLQPHLLVLRHPADARQAALAAGRATWSRRRRASSTQGVREVNLDLAGHHRLRAATFGREPPTGAVLAELVAAAVADVPGVRWVRVFYLYPETIDDALVELLAEHPRVVPYVDMPLQHAADAMLRRMKRGHGGERLRRVVERLERKVPDLTFRTAFIVGHPGETDAEFDELCDVRARGPSSTASASSATRTRSRARATTSTARCPRGWPSGATAG